MTAAAAQHLPFASEVDASFHGFIVPEGTDIALRPPSSGTVLPSAGSSLLGLSRTPETRTHRRFDWENGGIDADDEIRIIREGWRRLGDDVQTTLLSRAWADTDLTVAGDELLEFYWPPTAPIGYGGHAEPIDEAARKRPLMHGPRRTPWRRPTRNLRTDSSWNVAFGEAIADQTDPPVVHQGDDASLLADLERIEWWPMAVEEARRIRMDRVANA